MSYLPPLNYEQAPGLLPKSNLKRVEYSKVRGASSSAKTAGISQVCKQNPQPRNAPM